MSNMSAMDADHDMVSEPSSLLLLQKQLMEVTMLALW